MQMNEILKEIVNDLVIRELAERSADSLGFIGLLVLLALCFMRLPCGDLMLARKAGSSMMGGSSSGLQASGFASGLWGIQPHKPSLEAIDEAPPSLGVLGGRPNPTRTSGV